MKHLIQSLKTGLLWAVLLAFVGLSPNQLFAQDKKEVKEKKHKIEIRTSSDKQAEVVVEVKDGKIFVDGKEVAEVNTDGRRLRMRHDSMDGEDSSFFESKNGGRFLFNSNGGNEIIERIVDIENLQSQFGEARIQSSLSPLRDNLLELNRDGNAFAVYSNNLASFGNGETMKMDMRSRELAMKMRAMDGDTSEMEAELDKLLAEVFAFKQESHQKKVDQLREELQKLEQKLADRKSNQAEIISKRKKELLGTKDRFDW